MLAFLLIAGKWLGLAGMASAAVIGWFWGARISWETHYFLGMTGTLLYALAQVMTTYYFLGMRTAIVRAVSRHGLDLSLAEEAQAIKKRVSRMGHILPLLATVTLIVAGGVLASKLPAWSHWTLGAVTMLLGIRSGVVELRAFRDNAALFERAAALIPEQIVVAEPIPDTQSS